MISTLGTPTVLVGLAVLLIGCSPHSADNASRDIHAPAVPQTQATAGTSGDFGNAMPTARTGSAGAAPVMPTPQSNCKGGQYRGTYTCALDVLGIPATLDGEVSFMLEINQTVVPVSECEEFCPDLVIAEGSGTLFGIAGDTGWAFEAMLDGGLDCQTGEFRATTANGIYGLAGSSDANDPDALSTVVDPPLGEFSGMLSGTRSSGALEGIAGDWDLVDAVEFARCTGPFTVEIDP